MLLLYVFFTLGLPHWYGWTVAQDYNTVLVHILSPHYYTVLFLTLFGVLIK